MWLRNKGCLIYAIIHSYVIERIICIIHIFISSNTISFFIEILTIINRTFIKKSKALGNLIIYILSDDTWKIPKEFYRLITSMHKTEYNSAYSYMHDFCDKRSILL